MKEPPLGVNGDLARDAGVGPVASPDAVAGALDVVSVIFKGRRIEVFQRNEVTVRPGDRVVVEVERGTDIGEVWRLGACGSKRNRQGSRRILRTATEAERDRLELLRESEPESLAVAAGRLRDFNLPMHMVDAEFQADGNRVTFYFTADQRVDFRAFVCDLAAIFRTRIELRQISAREAARRLGGLGLCGRIACCCSFLIDTERVTLSMARDQNRLQCPTRLSGHCGRLICCLGFEGDSGEASPPSDAPAEDCRHSMEAAASRQVEDGS